MKIAGRECEKYSFRDTPHTYDIEIVFVVRKEFQTVLSTTEEDGGDFLESMSEEAICNDMVDEQNVHHVVDWRSTGTDSDGTEFIKLKYARDVVLTVDTQIETDGGRERNRVSKKALLQMMEGEYDLVEQDQCRDPYDPPTPQHITVTQDDIVDLSHLSVEESTPAVELTEKIEFERETDLS